jgi:hypothetical protein
VRSLEWHERGLRFAGYKLQVEDNMRFEIKAIIFKTSILDAGNPKNSLEFVNFKPETLMIDVDFILNLALECLIRIIPCVDPDADI